MTNSQDNSSKSSKKPIIAVSGKGGTGKTVMTTIIIKHLKKKDLKILAIDADPATSLPPALGVTIKKTIGDIREALVQGPGRVPTPDVPVDLMLEYQIREILAEIPKISILAIGRPEGPGCYCLVNDILRHSIEKFSGYYDVTIIDCEAGLEHLSRRTTRSVDIMIIVTDATQRGMNTAKLIKELAKSLEISFDKICVILNRASEEQAKVFSESALKYGIELAGVVPEDKNITEYDLAGKPLIDLPDDSPAVVAVGKILSKLEIFV
ncbi:MAG: AAA family ATPase [Pseudomonadota bacterium]